MATTANRPLVFVSYARQDAAILKRWHLVQVLASADAKADVWFDQYLTEGSDFNAVIAEKLSSAAVVVMFLSEAFFNSNYIRDRELPIIRSRAAADGLLTLPVLLAPCSLETADWFSGLQTFAYRNKPLTALQRIHDKEAAKLEIKRKLGLLLATFAERPPLHRRPLPAPDRPYLRRRCRVVPSPSPPLLLLLNGLLRDQLGFEHHPERLSLVTSLSEFERTIATAAIYEAFGRVTHALTSLNGARFTGNEEGCRRLYRGIAYEKLWKGPSANLSRAIQDYVWILSHPDTEPILRVAAQFNLHVCFEKRGSYEDVNFEAFLANRSLVMPTGEHLWHKALVMQMILCMKTASVFLHGDSVPAALLEQKDVDPGGYAKTLITWRRYLHEPPTDLEIAGLALAAERLPVNGRAAIIFELAQDLLAFGRESEFARFSAAIDDLAAKSPDPTVERYRRDLAAFRHPR